MKANIKLASVFMALMVVAGCSSRNDGSPVRAVGMPNPASVYCQQQGGKSELVKTESGTTGYCRLPNGERIEEWALYRRDNKK